VSCATGGFPSQGPSAHLRPNKVPLQTVKFPVIWAAATILSDLAFQPGSDQRPNPLIVLGFAAFGAANAARAGGIRSGAIAGLARAFVYLALVLLWQALWQRLGGPSAWSLGEWRHLALLVVVTVLTALASARASARKADASRPSFDERAL
jgi:hypothetical protein